jgi:hypothetical protein
MRMGGYWMDLSQFLTNDKGNARGQAGCRADRMLQHGARPGPQTSCPVMACRWTPTPMLSAFRPLGAPVGD